MMQQTNADYFALFGLDLGVFVDETALALAYQTLQKKHHPNRVARTPHAQAIAARQASYIHDAYATLTNPATRLFHILSLKAPDTKPRPLDGGFLLEMMQLRESLVDAEAKRLIIAQVHEQRSALLEQADGQLQNTDNWQAFADIAEKVRFLVNMEQQIGAEERL